MARPLADLLQAPWRLRARLGARLTASCPPVCDALWRLTREGLIGQANGKGMAATARDALDLEAHPPAP
jgi:DNA-binding GntR family transcriptional regulator